MDVATLGLTIDTSSTIPKLKELEGGLKRVGQATKQVAAESTAAMAQGARQQTQALTQEQARQKALFASAGKEQVRLWHEAAVREYRAKQAEIKLEAAKGMLSPEEARKRGREAAQAYNAEIIRALDVGTRTGAFTRGDADFVKLSGGLKTIREETQRFAQTAPKATFEVGRLREGVTTLAANALQAAPGVTQFGSILGSMALGSAMTVGVLGGIAAIGLAWRELTEDARKLKEETGKAIDELLRMEEDARLGATGRLSQKAGLAQMQLFDVQFARREDERALAQLDPNDKRIQFIRQRIQESIKLEQEYVRALKFANDEISRIHEEGRKKREQERKGETTSAAAAAREHQQSLVEAIRLGTASNAEMEEAILLLRQLRDVEDDLTLSREKRNAAAKLALDITKALNEAQGQSITRAMPVDLNRVRLPSAGTVRGPAVGPIDVSTLNAESEAARRAMEAVWDEAIRGIQRSFASGFEAIQRDGLQGFDSFADSLVGVFQGAAANIASILASDALGLDDLLKNLKAQSGGDLLDTLLGDGFGKGGIQRFGIGAVAGGLAGARGGMGAGVATGAISGLMSGGPWGAAIGALSGVFGGLTNSLFGSRAAIEAEIEARRQATREFVRGIEETLLDLRAGTGFGRASFDAGRSLQESFEQFLEASGLRGDPRFSGAPVGGGVQDWQAFLGFLRGQLEFSQSVGGSLGIPVGGGRGLSGEAHEALKKLLEVAEEQARKWAEAVAKANKEMTEDISIRRLVAQGRSAEADAMRMQIEQQRELARAAEQGLGQSVLADLEALHKQELQRFEEQRVLRDTEARQDYEVRRLAAEGKTFEADRMRLVLDHQREYNEAVLSGLSEATLAALTLAQGAESAAQAAAQAKQKADFAGDIHSNFLRSLGKDQEAAQYDLDRRQEEERRRAEEMGLGRTALDELEAVHAWEDAQLAAQYMNEAAGSLRDAASINARRAAENTVRSVTAISESSALRLVDIARSSHGLLAAIEMNTRGRPGDGVWVNSRSGGRNVHVPVTINQYGPVTMNQASAQFLSAEIARQLNEALGMDAEREQKYTGNGAV